jgi:peptide/nickel transport system permease protein
LSYRRYALERVGAALVLLWLAATGVYIMLHLGLGPPEPGTPVENPDYVRRVAAYYDESYLDFLARLVGEQSLGRSFLSLRSVNEQVLDASAMSISLLLFAFVFASLLAVPLGIVWGLRRPGRLTRPMKTLSAVLFGLSGFSTALLLIYWVGFKWGLLPLGGYCDLVNPATDCGGFADWSRALILPGISLGIFFVAVYLRLVSALVRNAGQARKRGDERARSCAGLSYVKLLGRDFGWGFGFALFVETIFGIPGLGRTLLSGLEGQDAPVIEGIIIFTTLLAMSVNLVVDLAVAAAAPRFRRF